MIESKRFKSVAAKNEWVAKHDHKYQIYDDFPRSSLSIEYRKLREYVCASPHRRSVFRENPVRGNPHRRSVRRNPSMADSYMNREVDALRRQVRELANAPLSVRKEAQRDWLNAMRSPADVAEHVRWLLNGDYGDGAAMVAREVANNSRMNRAAALGILIAALDHQTPQREASDAWHKLSKKDQNSVNNAILKEVKRWSYE